LQDLLAGIVIALGVYVVACPLMGRVDLYQQTNTLAPLTLVAASLALCTVCYPSQHKSAARKDAITITAVMVGLGMGSWLNYQLGYSVMVPKPARLPVALPSLWWLLTSLLQFAVGIVVVFALKVVVKKLTVRFFSAWYGLDKPDSKHPSVLVAYNYTTYACLGLAISFIDPLLFTALGFGRPAYYTEVV
jgi:fructose-specific phosphotransferase system IIC component